MIILVSSLHAIPHDHQLRQSTYAFTLGHLSQASRCLGAWTSLCHGHMGRAKRRKKTTSPPVGLADPRAPMSVHVEVGRLHKARSPKPAQRTPAASPRIPLDTERDQRTSAPMSACNTQWLLVLVSTSSQKRPRLETSKAAHRHDRGATRRSAPCDRRMLSVCCTAVLRDFDFELGNKAKGESKLQSDWGAASLRQCTCTTWAYVVSCFRSFWLGQFVFCVPFCFWQPRKTLFDAKEGWLLEDENEYMKPSPSAIVARGVLPTSQSKKRQHL